MFFHSQDWGFDVHYSQKKKYAKKRLELLGFPCCISSVCDYTQLKSVIDHNCQGNYLVIANDKNSSFRKGYFDIVSAEQLTNRIFEDTLNSIPIEQIEFSVIAQMSKIQDCFTATIITNGKGGAVVEFICDIVDNRLITSGGQAINKCQIIRLHDYSLVHCDNYNVLKTIYPYLKICMFFKGYYECSYSSVLGEKDVFFSYYSNDSLYQNILLDDNINCYPLASRCIMLSLIQNGFIY